MGPEEVHALIHAGETLGVEFKGEARFPLSDTDLVEAAMCLANRSGSGFSYLLIGVEDDGTVTGARPRHQPVTDTLRLQALIGNRTQPSLACRIEIVHCNDKPVIVIEIPVMSTPVGTTNGLYKRRALDHTGKPACIPYLFADMQASLAARQRRDPLETVLPGATWSDLDPIEFVRYRNLLEDNLLSDKQLLSLSDVDLAKALGVIEVHDNDIAVREVGMLVFGKADSLRRFVPTHEVSFQVLDRLDVHLNEDLTGPLVKVMEELIGRRRMRHHEQEINIGMVRIGVSEYPERAFREGVANALVHRDYGRPGAVLVQWGRDTLEISSPGGLPEGIRLNNLLTAPPQPRSRLLADAFKRAGLVERSGRGINTIFYEQLRNGRPAPSYDRSTETSVILVLPGGAANLKFVQLIYETSQAGTEITADELLILNGLFIDRQMTSEDAARLIQRGTQDARTHLNRLIEAGLVEARGDGKNRLYHLSAATFRKLGLPSAYVRQHGFERIQQEQMIIQFVEKHGRITRKEAAALCQIAEHQASYLIQRLISRGFLLPASGRGRLAYYEKAEETQKS